MLELEVKILGINIHETEEKLINIGAELISKELQINTVYDNSKGYISGVDSKTYLRIRETHNLLDDSYENTFTLKKLISDKGSRKSKEINVSIDSKNNLEEILLNLDINPVKVGKKERTSYRLNGVRFDIDIWDKDTYPDPYMEIEAETQEDINYVIKILGIRTDQISTKSITELRVEKGMQ